MNLTHVKINLLRILSGTGVPRMKNLRHNISTAVTMEHIVSTVMPIMIKMTKEIETRIKSLCDKEPVDYEGLQTAMDRHVAWVQCVEKCKAVVSQAVTSSKQQPPKKKPSSGSGSSKQPSKKKKQNSKCVPPRVGTQFQVSTLPETGETHPSPRPPEKRPQHFEPTDEMRSAYEASLNSAENNGVHKRKHNVHVTVPKSDTDTKRDTVLKSDTDTKQLEQRASKRAKKLQQQGRQMSPPGSSSGRDVFTSRRQASHVTVKQVEDLFQRNANGITQAVNSIPRGTRIQLAPDTLDIVMGRGGTLFIGTIATFTAWIMIQLRALCWDLPRRTNISPESCWPSELRQRMANGAFDNKLGIFEAVLNFIAQYTRFDMGDFKPGFLSHCSIVDLQKSGVFACGLIDEMTPQKLIRLIESFDREFVPGNVDELFSLWDGFKIGQYDESDCHSTFSGVEGARAAGSNAECWLEVNKTIPTGGTAFITVSDDSQTLQTFDQCYIMIQGLIEGRFPRKIGMKVLVWYPECGKVLLKKHSPSPPKNPEDPCLHPAIVTKIGTNYIEIELDGDNGKKTTEHPSRIFIHPEEGKYGEQTKFQREVFNSLPNTYLTFDHRKQTAVRQNTISLLAQMSLRFFQCRKRLDVILKCTDKKLELRQPVIYGGNNTLGWMEEVYYMLKCFETIIEKSFMCIEFTRWHRVDEQHVMSTSLEFECVCNDMKTAIEMFYAHPWLAERIDIHGKGVERGIRSDLKFAKILLAVYRRMKDLSMLISRKDIPSPYSLIWYRHERKGDWDQLITLPMTMFKNDGIVVYNIREKKKDLLRGVKITDLKRMTSILFEEDRTKNCWSYGTEHLLVESDEKLAPVNLNHYLTGDEIETFLKDGPDLQSIFQRCGFQINLPL